MMKVRIRKKWTYLLRQCVVKGLTFILFAISIGQRYVCAVLCLCGMCFLLMWASYNIEPCDGMDGTHSLCQEFLQKDVAGDLCDDICLSQTISISGCPVISNGLKILKLNQLSLKVIDSASKHQIREGEPVSAFVNKLDSFLVDELGPSKSPELLKTLLKDFDQNQDGKITLGEAQNLWRLLQQPFFLAYYIFQDNSAVPHFNGSCGGLSVWHQPYTTPGQVLYRRMSPWPVNLLSTDAYRWTLPSWPKRAKVMMSLLELVEDMYEKDGVRFHLCHVDGLTLYHHPWDHEVLIGEASLLLSARQIQKRLSNVTCISALDCQLTPQCQSSCNYSTQQCSAQLTQPTLVHVCQMIQEYLLFDAPHLVKANLTRLVRRCLELGRKVNSLDLVHSVLLIDLKSVIWKFIQNTVIK